MNSWFFRAWMGILRLELIMLQRKIQSYFNCEHAVSNNSGSSANLLAISNNWGRKAQKKVTTWLFSFSVVNYNFPNCSKWSYTDLYWYISKSSNMDPDKLASAAAEYKISAVMLIHTYGNPADLDKISNIWYKNIILWRYLWKHGC